MIGMPHLFVLVAVVAMPVRAAAAVDETMNEPCRTLRRLEAGKHQHMVAVGTSLTAGGAWVCQVYERLSQRFQGGRVSLTNAGIGGSASRDVGRIDRAVLPRNPDLVFIEFAINDAFEGYGISVNQARANLDAMIDRIHAHNSDCEVILMTMNAVAGSAADVRPHLEDYYQMYRDVAHERGLLLVDIYPQWKQLLEEDRARFDRYIPDGLHPNALGAREVITPAVLRAMGFPP